MKKLITIILILLVPFLIGAQTTYLTGPGTTYPQGLNTNGLVGYWKLGTNYITDGTILGNYESNPPNMTKSGTTVVDDPKYGPVRYFDGIDDYLYQEIIASGSSGYMATIDDGSFFWDPNFDFSPYLSSLSDKRYMLVAIDSSGNKAGGYIGGTGSGETLESELVDAWINHVSYPFETFTPGVGNLITQAINVALDYGICYKNTVALTGGLYKYTNAITLNSGTMPSLKWARTSGMNDYISFSINASGYKNIDSDYTYNYIGFDSRTNATDFQLTNLSFKQVISPPANESVILYSTKTGSTQSLAWEESGFDANDISSWEICRTDFQITEKLTVGAWIKGTSQSNIAIADKYSWADDQRSWSIESDIVGNYNKLRIILSDDGDSTAGHLKDYRSSIICFDDTWHFIIFTFDSGILRIFIDGVEDTNVNKVRDDAFIVLYDTRYPVYIAGIMNATTEIMGNLYTGNLADVFIYNRALFAAEIKHIYDHPPWIVTTIR